MKCLYILMFVRTASRDVSNRLIISLSLAFFTSFATKKSFAHALGLNSQDKQRISICLRLKETKDLHHFCIEPSLFL